MTLGNHIGTALRSFVAMMTLFVALAFTIDSPYFIRIVLSSAWLWLLIIVPIETAVAVILLKTDWTKQFVMVTVANFSSILMAIPVAWIVVDVLAQLFKFKPGPELFSRILSEILALWPGDRGPDDFWITLAGGAALCILAFPISAVVEYFYARLFVSANYHPVIWRWSWLANGLSYGCIVLSLMAMITSDLQRYFAERINGTEIYGWMAVKAAHYAPSGEVYVLDKDQVKNAIAELSRRQACQPRIDELLSYLQTEKCIAKATIVDYLTPGPCHRFRIVVPSHGSFVIAAKTTGPIDSLNSKNQGNLYWLYPVKTNGQLFLNVELSETNTVSANPPGQIFVAVPTGTRDLERILHLMSQYAEARTSAMAAVRKERFHEVEQSASKAIALSEEIHNHGLKCVAWVDETSKSDAKMLAFALAEQGNMGQLEALRELLYKDRVIPTLNSYYYDRLAQMYLKANKREEAKNIYRKLFDAVQKMSIPSDDVNDDTLITLEHYANLLAQDKNFAGTAKAQALAAKFRQQLVRMPNEYRRFVMETELMF